MRAMRPAIFVCLVALLLSQRPAVAHHSIVGQFDVSKTVALTGTIAKVEWINPHPFLRLQTKAANGRITIWELSTAPLAMLRKVGLTKEKLAGNVGEVVTITVLPALNGKPLGWVTRIEYEDGHFYSMSE